MKFKVASISPVNRRRDDLGDIEGLMRSLSDFGLIDPIVIQRDGTLVHGFRRYTATSRLGWDEVEVAIMEELDGDARFELENELDQHHKPLTSYERSKKLLQKLGVLGPKLAERAKADANASAVSADLCENPSGGRPPVHEVSREELAQAANVSDATIRNAEAQVSTTDRFGFMRPWPQSRVLAATKFIHQLPDAERDIFDSMDSETQELMTLMMLERGNPPDAPQRLVSGYAALDDVSRARVRKYWANGDHDNAICVTVGLPLMPRPGNKSLQGVQEATVAQNSISDSADKCADVVPVANDESNAGGGEEDGKWYSAPAPKLKEVGWKYDFMKNWSKASRDAGEVYAGGMDEETRSLCIELVTKKHLPESYALKILDNMYSLSPYHTALIKDWWTSGDEYFVGNAHSHCIGEGSLPDPNVEVVNENIRGLRLVAETLENDSIRKVAVQEEIENLKELKKKIDRRVEIDAAFGKRTGV